MNYEPLQGPNTKASSLWFQAILHTPQLAWVRGSQTRCRLASMSAMDCGPEGLFCLVRAMHDMGPVTLLSGCMPIFGLFFQVQLGSKCWWHHHGVHHCITSFRVPSLALALEEGHWSSSTGGLGSLGSAVLSSKEPKPCICVHLCLGPYSTLVRILREPMLTFSSLKPIVSCPMFKPLHKQVFLCFSPTAFKTSGKTA